MVIIKKEHPLFERVLKYCTTNMLYNKERLVDEINLLPYQDEVFIELLYEDEFIVGGYVVREALPDYILELMPQEGLSSDEAEYLNWVQKLMDEDDSEDYDPEDYDSEFYWE